MITVQLSYVQWRTQLELPTTANLLSQNFKTLLRKGRCGVGTQTAERQAIMECSRHTTWQRSMRSSLSLSYF